ncbi:MAG: hypothetical protein K0S65_5983 [Labilithrix sp.]|nr:hypothetical protein [Labilithrix sp.]
MTQSFAEKIKSEIADHDLSPELRARIDAWLKADTEFNVWFLVTTKRALADDELMELLDDYRESQEIVEEAWEAFQEQKDSTMLLEGITQSIHRMKLLQQDRT